MAQKEEKNIPTQKSTNYLQKKPILLAGFFYLFMALAICISTDSQLTKFQF